MAYEKTNWVNDQTPLNEVNLNKLEQGVKDAHDGIGQHDLEIDTLKDTVNNDHSLRISTNETHIEEGDLREATLKDRVDIIQPEHEEILAGTKVLPAVTLANGVKIEYDEETGVIQFSYGGGAQIRKQYAEINRMYDLTLTNPAALDIMIRKTNGTWENQSKATFLEQVAKLNVANILLEAQTFKELTTHELGANMNNQKVTQVAAGSVDGDAVNYEQFIEAINNVPYDNTDSDLAATNVKDALDELDSDVRAEHLKNAQQDILIADRELISNKVQEVVVAGTEEQYVSAAALYNKFLEKVDKAFTIAGLDMQSGSITVSALKTAIGEATTSAKGLMSITDKQRLDALHTMLGVTNDADNVVNTINEIMAIFAAYPEGADILTALNDKVDRVDGYSLTKNDLTEALKSTYDDAYTHSQVKTDNPHEVKFSELLEKPTTKAGYNITDVYAKPETYSQLEINTLLNNLSAVKGLKSTLLTPTELSNGDTISTNLLTNSGAYIVFTATDTSTEEIDSDTVPVSTIKDGKKFVFFDNQETVFTIGETNSTFETSEDVTLKINLLYLDDENVQAINVDFSGSLTNYLLTQTNVQEALEKIDDELKTKQDELDDKVGKVTGKGLSTEDYTTTEKNKLFDIEEAAQVNVQSDWEQEVDTADDYIKNKPAIPTKISDLTNDTGYITEHIETDPVFTAWDKSTGISITKSQVSDLITATQELSGLMSAADKTRLDALHALLEEDTSNSVVDSINEVIAIFNSYPEGADLVTTLAGKVNKVEGMGLSTNDLTDTLKSNYDTAYGWGDHAVEGYLKSITKAMVEAVLTGSITSHDHDGIYEPANANIQSHNSSTSNPHGVTKNQIELGNVDNTSDLDKPISTAQQTALDNKANATHQHTKSEITDFPTILVNKSYSKTITTENWDVDKKYAVTISGLEVSDTVLLSGADDIFTTNGLTATITANTLTFEVETLPITNISVNFAVIKTEGGTL